MCEQHDGRMESEKKIVPFPVSQRANCVSMVHNSNCIMHYLHKRRNDGKIADSSSKISQFCLLVVFSRRTSARPAAGGDTVHLMVVHIINLFQVRVPVN